MLRVVLWLSLALAACEPPPASTPARTPSAPAPSSPAPSSTEPVPVVQPAPPSEPEPPLPEGCCAGCEHEPKRVFVDGNQIVIPEEHKIRFEIDKGDIRSESFGILREVRCLLHREPGRVEISGHDDALAEEHRQYRAYSLTDRRARAVLDFLVKLGVEREHLEARGYGASKPLTMGTTAADRERNKRVELRFLPVK